MGNSPHQHRGWNYPRDFVHLPIFPPLHICAHVHRLDPELASAVQLVPWGREALEGFHSLDHRVSAIPCLLASGRFDWLDRFHSSVDDIPKWLRDSHSWLEADLCRKRCTRPLRAGTRSSAAPGSKVFKGSAASQSQAIGAPTTISATCHRPRLSARREGGLEHGGTKQAAGLDALGAGALSSACTATMAAALG